MSKEIIRVITTFLSDGLAASFLEEKKELYNAFGTGWVATADLWETDMLCVLFALGKMEVEDVEKYDCDLLGEEVKSVLDRGGERFRYVALLVLTELVVSRLQAKVDGLR